MSQRTLEHSVLETHTVHVFFTKSFCFDSFVKKKKTTFFLKDFSNIEISVFFLVLGGVCSSGQLGWFQLSHSEPGWFFSPANFPGPSCCCCSVAKSCLTLCNPIDCSTPGPPVLHYFLEFAQIHVHCVSDAIWLSLPLLPPSPFAFNLSQHHFNSVQISCSVLSDSLWPHGLEHARLPCPSPTSPTSPTSEFFPMSQQWPKYHSFGFSTSPSKEYSGLTSLRLTQLQFL